jgi:hypothetical protein
MAAGPLPSEHEQQYVLIGVAISLVAYGISFVLFLQCLNALQRATEIKRGSPRWVLATYTGFMFLLGTGYITTNTACKILAYTTHRNFPGGPVAWVNANYSSPTQLMSNICAVVSSWGSDGLLLYRCFIIYGSSFRAVRLVLLLPVILYIGEVISGVLLLVQVAHSPETIWNSVNLGLPYFALAAACNVAITLTIATPLLVHRFRLRKAFGRKNEYTEPYTSAIAILVESSAIYAVVAVIFIGFYARNNSASHLFLSTLSQVQVIAPLLVILRVATKKAWSSSTADDLAVASINRSHRVRPSPRISTHRGTDFIQFELHTNRGRSPSPTLTSPASKFPTSPTVIGSPLEGKKDSEDNDISFVK